MKGNLLLVDDEPVLLQKLKFILEDYADTVFTAENGLEALKVMAENKIACVVCDINMPIMNGVEVIKAMRKKGDMTPLIFYTGHGNKGLMLEAATYGAFDFLDKPSLDGLEEVIQKAMNFNVTNESSFMSDYTKLLSETKK